MAKKMVNDTTLQSTKQMLDELDALMEQMLSLPVHDPVEGPAFPKNVVKAPTLSATLTLLESPAPLPEGKAPTTVHPKLNTPHLRLPAAPELAPLSRDVVPASLLPKIEPMLADIPATEAPLTTVWCYLPLVWVNGLFDGITLVFGDPGALLRTQASRTFLGVSGIGLLLASIGWFVKDWLGWNW